ncbi:MAG TPA: hypothetical protein VGL71_11535 [Urbifossiella sp.]|jgi:hypothetical protein
MRRIRFLFACGILSAACLVSPFAQSQPAKSRTPKLEPVADAKLLMNGIADPNFKGLSRMLADKPKDDEAWEFARGRALLIAETGNLLMIRPPKERNAQDLWMTHGMDLRDSAATLAKVVSEKDYVKSRAALAGVANACNRCHKAIGIATRVQPFPDDEK